MRRVIREKEPVKPSTRLATDLTSNQHSALRTPQVKEVRGDLDWIVMRCLEKDRNRRYETANGLASDLGRHIRNEPVLARPPSNVYRFQRLVRRNKLSFAAGAAVMAALLIGSITSAWQAWRAVRAEHLATDALRHESSLREKAETAANQVKMTLAASDFSRAIDLIFRDKQSEALAYLTRSLSLNPSNEAAAVRVTTLLASCSWWTPVLTLEASSNASSAPFSAHFSPDGKLILTASPTGSRVWDSETGRLLFEPVTGTVLSAEFNADGTRIVTTSLAGAQVWDARSGRSLMGSLTHGDPARSARFSPKTDRILTTAQRPGGIPVQLWDANSGQPLIGFLKDRKELWFSALFSPDGKQIVTAVGHVFGPDGRQRNEGAFQVWDASTGSPVTAQIEAGMDLHSAQFSPDGKKIATACWTAAQIWDAQTGKALTQPLPHKGEVNSAQFSPDGKQLATASSDQTAMLWDVQTGRPLHKPLIHAGGVNSAQFSPDGRSIVTASQDGTARVWDVSSGQLIGEPLEHGIWMNWAEFSPDGKRILTTSQDGAAQVWEMQGGPSLSQALKQHGEISWAQFSPDGKRVVTASKDGTAQVWDAYSGLPVTGPLQHGTNVEPQRSWTWQLPLVEALRKYGTNVISAQFSPDGRRIVTASNDHTARVWDAQNGQLLNRLVLDNDWVQPAVFSPDGKRIVTAAVRHRASVGRRER